MLQSKFPNQNLLLVTIEITGIAIISILLYLAAFLCIVFNERSCFSPVVKYFNNIDSKKTEDEFLKEYKEELSNYDDSINSNLDISGIDFQRKYFSYLEDNMHNQL